MIFGSLLKLLRKSLVVRWRKLSGPRGIPRPILQSSSQPRPAAKPRRRLK
jgi:hypothetical protein